MKFATKAIHVGTAPDPSTGSIMPPIYMTSTYLQEAPGINKGYDYTRAHNPNFTILEAVLAALEEAKYATIFSSGLGALTALISTLSKGDRVVGINGMYGGTFRLFHSVFNRFGIEMELIEPSALNQLDRLLDKKLKWLFFETPTNPLLEIFDISALTQEAKKHGVLTIIDNTFATPYFQNPLKLGVDAVWHSTTKYIGGHSDVIGGAVMTNSESLQKEMEFARKAIGLNPSPFDAWLLTRGVKTLALRMEKHQQNGMTVAQFFEQQRYVKKVHYPGLSSHSNHALFKKQMRGFGGMVTVDFNLSLEDTIKLISSFKLFALAESLGGIESLVSHPATMTHASVPAEERAREGITDGLVRFSVGVEDVEDLIADLKAGMDKIV